MLHSLNKENRRKMRINIMRHRLKLLKYLENDLPLKSKTIKLEHSDVDSNISNEGKNKPSKEVEFKQEVQLEENHSNNAYEEFLFERRNEEKIKRAQMTALFDHLRETCNLINDGPKKPAKIDILMASKRECDFLTTLENDLLVQKKMLIEKNAKLKQMIKNYSS